MENSNARNETLIEKLEQLRVYFDFKNDSRFAESMGLKPNHYSKIKRGQSPTFQVMQDCMRRLGIRLDFFAVPSAHPFDYLVDAEAVDCQSELGRLRRENEEYRQHNKAVRAAFKELVLDPDQDLDSAQ